MWRYQGPTRAAQCHVNVPHSTHIRFVQVTVVLLVSTGVSVAEIIRQLKEKLEDMEVSRNFAPWDHVVTVANSMDRISSTRHQIKDMNMIFPVIPQNPVLVEWSSLVTVVGESWVGF